MSVLSKSERVFYITQTLEMEVNSGGFSQFFYNFRGNFTNRLIGAFSEIGAQATAAICQKAIAAVACDTPIDKDNLNTLNYAYAIKNKTYFETDGCSNGETC